MPGSTSIITLPKLEILNQEISPAESVGVVNPAINPLSSLTVFYDASTNAPPPSSSSTIETTPPTNFNILNVIEITYSQKNKLNGYSY